MTYYNTSKPYSYCYCKGIDTNKEIEAYEAEQPLKIVSKTATTHFPLWENSEGYSVPR